MATPQHTRRGPQPLLESLIGPSAVSALLMRYPEARLVRRQRSRDARSSYEKHLRIVSPVRWNRRCFVLDVVEH